MAIVTDRKDGLFPGPGEIKIDCSCPDWAGLCKHLAAVLYGVGVRLDDAPELLFKLRGVDHHELIQTDAAELTRGSGTRRRLAPAALGDVFGVDLDDDAPAAPTPRRPRPAPVKSTKKTAKKKTVAKRTAKKTATKAAGKKATAFRPTGPGVRELRTKLGLNRSAFARELGVSAPTITNWESAPGPIRPQLRSLAALRRLHKSCSSR